MKLSEEHLKTTPAQPFGELTPFWWNWYPIQAFRREAEELLREADAKANSEGPKR
jgi:hypothetical protein